MASCTAMTMFDERKKKSTKKSTKTNTKKSAVQCYKERLNSDEKEKSFQNYKTNKVTQQTLQEIQFNRIIGVGMQQSKYTILKLTEDQQKASHEYGLTKVRGLLSVIRKLIKNGKMNKVKQQIELLDSYVEQVVRIYSENATHTHYMNISETLMQIWSIHNVVTKPILRIMHWLVPADINQLDIKVFDCFKEIALITNMGKLKQEKIYSIMGIGFAKTFLRMYSAKLNFSDATVLNTHLLLINDQNIEIYDEYIKKQGVRASEAKSSSIIQDYRRVCSACYQVESDSTFKVCGKCKKTVYCSESCCLSSWSTHKLVCCL